MIHLEEPYRSLIKHILKSNDCEHHKYIALCFVKEFAFDEVISKKMEYVNWLVMFRFVNIFF